MQGLNLFLKYVSSIYVPSVSSVTTRFINRWYPLGIRVLYQRLICHFSRKKTTTLVPTNDFRICFFLYKRFLQWLPPTLIQNLGDIKFRREHFSQVWNFQHYNNLFNLFLCRLSCEPLVTYKCLHSLFSSLVSVLSVTAIGMHLFKAPHLRNGNLGNILHLCTVVTFIRNIQSTLQALSGGECYSKGCPAIKILSAQLHCAFFGQQERKKKLKS